MSSPHFHLSHRPSLVQAVACQTHQGNVYNQERSLRKILGENSINVWKMHFERVFGFVFWQWHVTEISFLLNLFDSCLSGVPLGQYSLYRLRGCPWASHRYHTSIMLYYSGRHDAMVLEGKPVYCGYGKKMEEDTSHWDQENCKHRQPFLRNMSTQRAYLSV